MSKEELEYINEHRQEIEFEKGEIIIKANDEVKQFLYLKKGLVKLVKPELNAKERIISIARPMDFVSLLSTFSDTHYSYSITALEKSVVCSIDLDSMKDVIRQNGAFALELMEQVSRSTNSILQATYELDNKQLRGRIAFILLWFAQKIYHKNSYNLPISRREIGELINMTTENVIRILSEFRKDGILKIDGKNISIENMEILEKISKSG
jgi:CRP/FNR family transcriptional regulator